MIAPTNFYLNAVKGRPSAEVFNAMLHIYSLLQMEMERYFGPYDLTPVKFNALLLIKYLGGKEGLSQTEISHHMIVSPSNITRLIDRLIADGYAERTVSVRDRRVKVIKLTKSGSQIVDKVLSGYGDMIQDSVYLLERSEVEQLSNLLLKWFNRLDETKRGLKSGV